MRSVAILGLLIICATAAALADPAPSRLRVGQLAALEFAPGSAVLAPASLALAATATTGSASTDPLAAAIAWADLHPQGVLVLDGHADPDGPAGARAQNAQLPLRRAKAVRARLVAVGVNPEQIVIAAFGDGPRRDRSVVVWGATR
jgi:outer membrane protein OmpA-like peptidoglycan-associated protein